MTGHAITNNSSPAGVAANPKLLDRKLLVQLGVLLTLTFVAVIVGSAFNQQFSNLMPEQERFPSVFNHKASGTSGAMELFDRLKIPAQEWVLPYRQLPTVSGTLVVISPLESPTEQDLNTMLDWVKAGNQLIFLDDFSFGTSSRLPEKLGAKVIPAIIGREQEVTVHGADPLFSHVDHLAFAAASRLLEAPSLVSDRSQRIVLSELKHGKGRVVLGTAVTLFSNQHLSQKSDWQNFQFFFNLVQRQNGTVWFDERCHGFSHNANIFMFLLRGPSGLVLAQLLLILAIGVACNAQRFGKIEAVNTKRKISNLEFIDGLANTYSRAKANAASLEIIVGAFRMRLCKALSVSPHEPMEHLYEALRTSNLLEASLRESIETFLRRYEIALTMPNLPDSEFKLLMVRCDKITDLLIKALARQSLASSATGTSSATIAET